MNKHFFSNFNQQWPFITKCLLSLLLLCALHATALAQLVPPTNVSVVLFKPVTPPGSTTPALLSIRVSWTPISYTGDGRYYEILSAPTPGGPYTSRSVTVDETASLWEILNTDLPGGENYFVVRTVLPADANNPNGLASAYSEEVTFPQVGGLGPPDLPIMQTLREDYGWNSAFFWRNSNPCPPGNLAWPGVTCDQGRVITIQGVCGTAKLTTAFPAELANLSSLTTFDIKDCWTDTNNPVMANNVLGGLTQLNRIRLDDNTGLTGTLGDLAPNFLTMSVINFSVINSGLSGPIPSGFLQKPTVVTSLNQCHFSGALPADAKSLFFFNVSGNQLEGILPNDLVNTNSNNVRLRYNKFDVVNTPAGNIDIKDPQWRNTQTVPPTNVQVAPTGANSASLSWTPIGYTWDGGYYEVLASQTPGGPYASYGKTSDKTAAGLNVTGLPGGTNYFVVRTFTPAHTGDFTGSNPQLNDRDNPNDLTSVNSEEVSASIMSTVIGVAKNATLNGTEATFDFYLENFGTESLGGLSLPEDLDAVFGAGNYTFVSPPALVNDPGTITLNGGFDGSSDKEIFASGSSLPVGGTAQIRMVVNVTAVTDVGFGCGVYSNQVTASAEGGTVSDLSDSGTDPDPNGNGDPTESGENDPTVFTVVRPHC
ncbi:MAG: hypothetical protein H6559_32105 [Lewinellaceae bacterium]|nr:hypothetical protein [Lewinellaceae bacterium]